MQNRERDMEQIALETKDKNMYRLEGEREQFALKDFISVAPSDKRRGSCQALVKSQRGVTLSPLSDGISLC